jgi:hypothetical protein
MKELPLVKTGKSNKEDGFLGLVSFDVFLSLHTIQSVDLTMAADLSNNCSLRK